MSIHFSPHDQQAVVYQSPLAMSSSPGDAPYLLLGETHDNFEQKKINARFIDRVILPDSLLLVESAHSLRPLCPEKSSFMFQTYQISQYAQARIRAVLGWDWYNYMGDAWEEDPIPTPLTPCNNSMHSKKCTATIFLIFL